VKRASYSEMIQSVLSFQGLERPEGCTVFLGMHPIGSGHVGSVDV